MLKRSWDSWLKHHICKIYTYVHMGSNNWIAFKLSLLVSKWVREASFQMLSPTRYSELSSAYKGFWHSLGFCAVRVVRSPGMCRPGLQVPALPIPDLILASPSQSWWWRASSSPKVRHLTTQSQTFNKLIGLVGHDIFGDITSAAMQSCFVLFFVGTTIRPKV